MKGKALLFLNGVPPDHFPPLGSYELIACSDGAFHYLKKKGFPLEKIDFISGDFDSHSGLSKDIYQHKFIHTPDQNKTDFHKALEIISEKGASKVDVYGGSGGEMDHFLGNLSVAFQFRPQLDITFYDEFSTYFFVPEHIELKNIKGRLVSLYPFPRAENVVTQGLTWSLSGETLDITARIGTRNIAEEDTVTIAYKGGALMVFVGRDTTG